MSLVSSIVSRCIRYNGLYHVRGDGMCVMHSWLKLNSGFWHCPLGKTRALKAFIAALWNETWNVWSILWNRAVLRNWPPLKLAWKHFRSLHIEILIHFRGDDFSKLPSLEISIRGHFAKQRSFVKLPTLKLTLAGHSIALHTDILLYFRRGEFYQMPPGSQFLKAFHETMKQDYFTKPTPSKAGLRETIHETAVFENYLHNWLLESISDIFIHLYWSILGGILSSCLTLKSILRGYFVKPGSFMKMPTLKLDF